MNKVRYFWLYAALAAALLSLCCIGLMRGSVQIPLRDVARILTGSFDGREAWRHIVLESRLPQTLTALLAGAALAVSGLMLQTLFKNPLAGPSILGISDGANLGVAIAMIYLGAASYLTTIVAALIGAFVVLLIILGFSRKVSSNVMLLIIGIMVGYLASSVISILNYHASADKVHQYVMWGMGDFSGVSLSKLPWLAGFSLAGLFAVWAAAANAGRESRTATFSRIAAISGSFWYPGFPQWLRAQTLMPGLKAVYLSLGRKEAEGKNPHLKDIAAQTREVAEILTEKGVRTVFSWTEGTHFAPVIPRLEQALNHLSGTNS